MRDGGICDEKWWNGVSRSGGMPLQLDCDDGGAQFHVLKFLDYTPEIKLYP